MKEEHISINQFEVPEEYRESVNNLANILIIRRCI